MIELTPEQRQCATNDDPPVVVDPLTSTEYVLVRKEVYDRWRALLTADDYDPDEGLAHMNEVMSDDDTNDPLLESYQRFGPKP